MRCLRFSLTLCEFHGEIKGYLLTYFTFFRVACDSLDIRNSVSALNRLHSCTVIEGHLHVVLNDRGRELDFANLSFPRLREITDYLLLYRVSGVRSLSTLFPNLAVIRGQLLLYNYALVIFEMPDMYDIGLMNLMQITRGSVRCKALRLLIHHFSSMFWKYLH